MPAALELGNNAAMTPMPDMETRILAALRAGPTYIGLLVYLVDAKSARSRDFRAALTALTRAGRIELIDAEAGTWRLTEPA